MTDQCKHCMCRSDLAKCEATECGHHDNWYAIELKRQIKELRGVAIEASEYLDTNHLTSIGSGSILHQKFKDLAL